MSARDQFGVFILRDGVWQQWTTGAETYVRREAAYLRDGLGLKAAAFSRVSA